MTERKPRNMSFVSWIDQQIQEATERGAFDNLPGAGKPLPDRGAFSTDVWIRDYLEREGVSPEEALPAPLRLRKETERLAGSVHLLRSEQEVREVVEDLNDRIRAMRRLPEGPPVFVALVDVEAMVSVWRQGQASEEPAVATGQAPAPEPRRSRWWSSWLRGRAFSRRK